MRILNKIIEHCYRTTGEQGVDGELCGRNVWLPRKNTLTRSNSCSCHSTTQVQEGFLVMEKCVREICAVPGGVL